MRSSKGLTSSNFKIAIYAVSQDNVDIKQLLPGSSNLSLNPITAWYYDHKI